MRGGLLFVADSGQPPARRATDIIVLAGCVLGLVAISFAAIPLPGFLRALVTFLGRWPHPLDGLWQILADLLLAWAAFLAVAACAFRFRPVAINLIIAVILATAVCLVVGRVVANSWPNLWQSLRHAEPPPYYPAIRLALPAVVVLTAKPDLTRPLRRFGWYAVALATLSTMILGGTSPLGAVAALLIAAGCASTIHLVFGSNAGRPSVSRIQAALTDRDIHVTELSAANRQQTGLFTLTARNESGHSLVVKVYGRDAHDTALLSTVWRTIWYRRTGFSLRLSRLGAVEHEALATLLASQAGIRTDAVATVGSSVADDALLVLLRQGDPLPANGPAPDAAQIWALVDKLRAAGIAHGNIDPRNLIAVDGEIGIIDFRGADLAPSLTQQRADEAQALITTVMLSGPQPALQAAVTALGPDRLAAILPFVQQPLLTPAQRQACKSGRVDLDQLRADAAALTATTPPQLQQLQRITPASVLKVVLPAIGLFALISAFADLDWSQFFDQLRDATWWLAVFGFVAAQTPRFAQAVSELGACPVPLPLGPLYVLQLGMSYVNIALPGTAARIAISVRFFQRHGIQPGTALAVGALDSVSQYIVQATILVSLLLFTTASLELDLDAGTAAHATRLLIIVVVLAGAIIGIVAAVPRWRRFIGRWVVRLASESREALRGLNSPRRLGLMFGGNLATEFLFAAALGVFTRAFGYSIGFGDLLFINISVSLLAGLLPIPGGIGVAEGALSFGLMQAGMTEEAAFAAVLLYRLSTFYLPPIWGYFAFGWLQRNKHL